MTVLKLGVSKVDITPPMPVPLAGFAHRTGLAGGVSHPLYSRTFVFEQEERKVLLISADLIWWGTELVQRLRADIDQRWGIAPKDVFLHATHSHSGPQTSGRFTPSLGSRNPAYITWLEGQVHAGIARAVSRVEPVSVEKGTGQWQVGIHRRRVVDDVCTMAPNPDGPNDREVTVVRFRTSTGATKGILVHATCHPTTTDENKVSSEFPGVAMEQVESYCGSEVVAAHLQGFCGDVRPALVKEDVFFRGTDEDVQRIGRELGNEVVRVLETEPMQTVTPGDLSSEARPVSLPFSQVPDMLALQTKRFEPGIAGEWASLLLDHPDRLQPSIPLELTLFRIANGVAFLTANAEIVVEYGLLIKGLFAGRVLPVGYTNGMIGYVPTARQVGEGGYEAADSFRYFGLPAPFSSQIEADIYATINDFKRGWQ